jgi:hypothetical protein
MKVDAVKLISGIKPAVLKGLLRKDRFDTPTAMNWLGQDEPKVTTTLKGLQKSGWIEFEGTSESVDYWRPGNKGQRLTATRLLKRISAAEGRQILAPSLTKCAPSTLTRRGHGASKPSFCSAACSLEAGTAASAT